MISFQINNWMSCVRGKLGNVKRISSELSFEEQFTSCQRGCWASWSSSSWLMSSSPRIARSTSLTSSWPRRSEMSCGCVEEGLGWWSWPPASMWTTATEPDHGRQWAAHGTGPVHIQQVSGGFVCSGEFSLVDIVNIKLSLRDVNWDWSLLICQWYQYLIGQHQQ